MAYVDRLSAAPFAEQTAEVDHNVGKDHSLNYLLAFIAVGIFFSIMSLAFTRTEWLPEGAAALAPEMQTVMGLNIADIAISAKLDVAEHSAH
jgi:hypothetical protein